ncbi:hypothetical protein ACA910_007002 [Epithemia clementina (nom. ined.)]
MKVLSIAILSSLAIFKGVAADTIYDAYQSTTCEGLEYSTCSRVELDFFAHTVEKTYNAIYGPNWYLFDTKWEGVRGENPQAVEKKQDQGERIMQSGGGWGCDLCPHDDDSFALDKTWNTDGNVWGDALALALRGSGMECFKSVSHCGITMDETKRMMDNAVAKKDNVANTMYDAYQSTTCEGLDYATCTSAELDFFAHSVEKTYNAIYGPNWYLFDTKWEGVRSENPQALEKKQEQGERIMQSGGGWGCDLCPHDDDSFALDKTWNADGNVWGDALALALRGSGMECFKSVSHCGITMDETKRLMEKKEDDAISAMRVKCQNVDWSVLTPTEQKFAASKLEKSFNTVFKNVDGLKQLKDVELASDLTVMKSMVDLLVGFWWEGRYGYFTGSYVSDEAIADATGLRSNKQDRMIVALWESAFENFLHRGPYSALSRAGDCQIEMKVVDAKL